MSNAVSERKHKTRHGLPRVRRSSIYLAVHRFDNSVYYRRIEREAFLLLLSLQQQHTLSEAIEIAFTNSKLSPEQQAQKIQKCFAHAAELGWFCSSAHRPLPSIAINPLPKRGLLAESKNDVAPGTIPSQRSYAIS